MTTWGVTRWIGVVAIVLGACAGGDDLARSATTTSPPTTSTTSTTAPERPASTTTTAFDPASVEGQVEAAYLRSWDVYADAVYNLKLDERALASVYADPLLSVRRHEIAKRINEHRASWVRVDHAYTVHVDGENAAIVVDTYTNHQRLIDPVTHDPTEADPTEKIADVFTLRNTSGTWVVVDQQRFSR